MTQDAWPTPTDRPSREPLPRVEDLPVADQGYEQESVKAAFDSFYRHAAQLDAALRTLEAVDSFHRQAAALRADLRSLRTAGWTQQPWSATPAYGYTGRAPREGISPAVWRIAGEVVLLIAAAVALGVAKVPWWVIVLVMAAAWLVVLAIEWAAARESFVPHPAALSPHPVVEATPAEQTEEGEESIGWAAFEEAQEPSDAMTMIGVPQAEEAPAAEPAAEEAPAAERPVRASGPGEGVSGGPGGCPHEEAPARRRWRRQQHEEQEPAQHLAPELPRHVRVLQPDQAPAEPSADPWERGFDLEPAEPDEETDEELSALAADADPPARRRFRRR